MDRRRSHSGHYAVDIVSRLNETASESEEQVCELLKYDREFQHIAGGVTRVGGLDALASLDELEKLRGLQGIYLHRFCFVNSISFCVLSSTCNSG